MSVSAAHAGAFYRELAEARSVWTIEDAGGIPAPKNADGRRAMPFWSKASRAQTVIDTVAAYAGFHLTEVPVDDWLSRWLPGIESDGLLVGLNWSGAVATGYDVAARDVLRRLGTS